MAEQVGISISSTVDSLSDAQRVSEILTKAFHELAINGFGASITIFKIEDDEVILNGS